MRKSSLRLYAPFIGLALAQALFISLLPSKAPGKSSVASGGLVSAGPAADGTTAAAGSTDASAAAAAGPGASVAQKGLSAASAKTASAFLNGGDVTKVEGDKSHCKGDRQTGLVWSSPPCVAKWPAGANNGAKTFQGVSDKEILVVNFNLQANEQVNTLLATQGLAESEQTRNDMDKAGIDFVNKHYELYGRQIKFVEWKGTANCPTTPPNPGTCQTDAQQVIDMHPALIVFGSGLYSSIFDQFARAGIPVIGGNWFGDTYFTGRRPYRYDIVMDGTQSAKVIAEYYCKKMANRNADHSGKTIHVTIGDRDKVQRKLGVITPDDPANVAAAQVVVSQVQACQSNHVKPPLFTYQSDINKAQTQTDNTTAGLIQAKVTTVVCMCDPIAPIFGTNGFSRQQYFPEVLGSGEGFTDYDQVGRLYDPNQMHHAFGPSQLTNPIDLSASEAAIVWHDTGHSGDPCNSCNLNWAYGDLLGQMLQQAGPNLNPLSLEKGMITANYSRGGWDATGHDATKALELFGPGDYTAGSDYREIYWSDSTPSAIDGKPGSYVAVNGGRRYKLGELSGDLSGIPVYPS
jgi:hypothetical protein